MRYELYFGGSSVNPFASFNFWPARSKGTPSGRAEHGADYYLAHILDKVRKLNAAVAALKKEN
ncbi:hypothetical protein P6B95_30795 [Streptomyces atratus]|uniref:hypothetical protein n=1 Tax=Streptomyces atratus TaxID=1893 RepID=UPI0016716A8B|nr:hypothetical protein [Streptomyces atratus]WPW31340.1 hypothetical protein P6B95_30795 [Streptomyces atratus]GGT07431.1 hypothetical protein GCM10010207_02230 [Streptomyces atratus]